jgi:cytochrome P450
MNEDGYAEVMDKHTERMLEAWHQGQIRDLHEDLMRLTLGIVAKTLCNAEVAGEAGAVRESIETVMNDFMSPMRWFGRNRKVNYASAPACPGHAR